jgi:uncharacterized protein YjbI with pentapeptide repeats
VTLPHLLGAQGARLTRQRVETYLAAKRSFFRADMQGLNLSSLDFRQVDLTGTNLREADLTGGNLENANLARTNLSEVQLSGATFSSAQLDGANLRAVLKARETELQTLARKAGTHRRA